VDNIKITSLIPEYSSSVFLKGIWNSNTTSNGTALIDLLHHIFFTLKRVKLVYSVYIVGIRDETRFVWLAILAHVNGSTLDAIVMTTSLINGAGLISHISTMHELEGTQSVATVAAIVIHGAGNYSLRRDVDIWPLSFTSDLNTIGES
jgi:hypothetical protein